MADVGLEEDDPILLELSQLSQQRAADLAQFRQTREALEAEVARLRAVSEEREAKCQRLECDLAKTHRELSQMSQQRVRAEHAESQLATLQSQCTRLSEELKNVRKAKATAVQRNEQHARDIQQQNRTLAEERDRVVQESRRQAQMISALEAQLSETQQHLDALRHTERETKAKSNDLMRRADLASEGEQAALNALNNAHDKIAALETELRELEEKYTKTVASLNSKINKLLPLQSRPAITQEQYRQQCQAINEMQQQVRGLRANLELKESEAAAMRQSEEALKRQLAVALDISASLEEHTRETKRAAPAPEEALESLSSHISHLQQQLDDAHTQRQRDLSQVHGVVMRTAHLAGATLRCIDAAHARMIAATHAESTSADEEGQREDRAWASSRGIGGSDGHGDTSDSHSHGDDEYDDDDSEGDAFWRESDGKRGTGHRSGAAGNRKAKSVASQLSSLASVVKKMHARASNLESRVERFKTQQHTERARLDSQLRESWDVIRSQESALMEREKAITALKQQADALKTEAFEERQAFAEEKRNLMQHLGRLESQSTELRDLQNDHVKQLMGLQASVKQHEAVVSRLRSAALSLFDAPALQPYKPDGVEDAEAVMEAVVHGVRAALEESGVQRGLYEGHVAEKVAQVQLLKEQLRSLEEHSQHLQRQLAVAADQLDVASQQRTADTQRQEKDGAMIVELQNRLVAAMRTLRQEQAHTQQLQEELEAAKQRWKSEWQACHRIIGGVRKVGLSLCERIARILAVARCTGPALCRVTDCVAQTTHVLRSTDNTDRVCWSLKTAALAVIACRRLQQRRSLLDPDVVAASWRRAYRPRTPTHEHVEDLEEMDEEELLHHAAKHVEVSNQMHHLKSVVFDRDASFSITDDMRPIRTVSDFLHSLLGAVGVEVSSRFGLRLMTWYPQRRVLCDAAQKLRAELVELRNKQQMLTAEVEELKGTNTSLHKKNTRQSEELSNITARVQELDATNHRIYRELHELNQSHIEAGVYHSMKRQLEDARSYISELEPLSESNARQERMLRQLRQELRQRERDYEERLEDMKAQLEQAAREAEELQKKLEEQEATFKDKEEELESQIKHLKRSKAALLHELQQLDGAVGAPSEQSIRSRPSTAATADDMHSLSHHQHQQQQHYPARDPPHYGMTHSTPVPLAQWMRRTGRDGVGVRSTSPQHEQPARGNEVMLRPTTDDASTPGGHDGARQRLRSDSNASGGGNSAGSSHHHHHDPNHMETGSKRASGGHSNTSNTHTNVSSSLCGEVEDSGISEMRRRLHRSMLGQLDL